MIMDNSDNMDNTETKVKILDYHFKIKCANQDIDALKESARYVENKMSTLRGDEKIFTLDRVAIITALNIAHEFLSSARNSDILTQLSNRVADLNKKITLETRD